MRTAKRIVHITDGIWAMYGYSNFGFMVSYEESYKFRTDIVQYSKSKKL